MASAPVLPGWKAVEAMRPANISAAAACTAGKTRWSVANAKSGSACPSRSHYRCSIFCSCITYAVSVARSLSLSL
jgi:hypothetical protein